MEEFKFSDFELNTTKGVLDRLILMLSKSENGKFTAETIKMTRDIIIKIIKV